MRTESFFAIFFLGISLYPAGKAVRLAFRKRRGRQWTAVTGTVTSKKVQALSGGRTGKLYEPRVYYRYTAGPVTFTDFVSLGLTLTPEGANGKLDKVGDTLAVRYNPERPREHLSELEGLSLADAAVFLVCLGLGLQFIR